MKKEFVFRFVLALCIFFLVYQFGVRPLLNPSGDGRRWAEGLAGGAGEAYDVVVLGEDPDGIAAAVSAARLGARTLLLAGGEDVGGIVARCKLARLEAPAEQNGRLLNGGLLSEFYGQLSDQFSVEKYMTAAGGLVKNEKSLDVEFGAVFDSAVLEGDRLTGVNVSLGAESRSYKGRFFIDSTRDGTLLEACNVPYTTGSADLNMKNSFMPAMLNFEMSGPITTGIRKLVQAGDGEFSKGIADYRVLDSAVRIDTINVLFPGKNKIILEGLEIAGIDPADPKQTARAYKTAVKEAGNLADYLSGKFTQFRDWKLSEPAKELYFRENRHFSGLYELSVNDVLENRYFDDTVAMGSLPVQTGKFADKGIYFAGKPDQYGIPLGCLVPRGPRNLMMTGSKASYSSLAASSAGAPGVGIAEGEAAGVAAVYSLYRNTDPSAIIKDREMIKELRGYLVRQKMYLPNVKSGNKNAGNWSYPAVRQLLTLGLIAGGEDNDFKFDTEARERDFAVLLLNGVYRLGEGKYTLELDSRVRPHFTGNALTKDGAAEILTDMYGIKGAGASAYGIACEKGYINDVMQLALKDKKTLTMDDVYYLGAYNIKLFTGKDIKN